MKYRINLISKKKDNFFDKTVYFFLNYLRYVFVITQLIIISVFFYRFTADQRIIDLKESIDQKQEIVKVVSPLIIEAKEIDKRVKEIKKVIAKQKETEQRIEYILSIFPEKIYLSNLTTTDKSLILTGVSYDAGQLQAFYYRLKKENKFSLIELQNIKKTENGYSFILYLNNFKSY